MNGPPMAYGHVPNIQTSNSSVFIVQQPETAKVVARGKEKDRKPIDPPPILQILVNDQYNNVCSFLHNPYLFCCCTLWNEYDDTPKKALDDGTPVLTGNTSSSQHKLKDLHNNEGAFFVFGDLCAGVSGRVRLHFQVYEYKPHLQRVEYVNSVTSKSFEVSTSKDWDGIRESTPFSRSLSDQGVRLRLRKESRGLQRRNLNQQSSTASSVPPTPLRPIPEHDDDQPDSKRLRMGGPNGSNMGYPSYLAQNSGLPVGQYVSSSATAPNIPGYSTSGRQSGSYNGAYQYPPSSQYPNQAYQTYAPSQVPYGYTARPANGSQTFAQPYHTQPSQNSAQPHSPPSSYSYGPPQYPIPSQVYQTPQQQANPQRQGQYMGYDVPQPAHTYVNMPQRSGNPMPQQSSYRIPQSQSQLASNSSMANPTSTPRLAPIQTEGGIALHTDDQVRHHHMPTFTATAADIGDPYS